MVSADVRWVVPKYRSFGRDVFRFLGRVGTATKSLKGRLAVAQPPGATMAVTGNKVSTRRAQCKDTTGERLTTDKSEAVRRLPAEDEAGHFRRNQLGCCR
jgi:hypothetical protein